MAEDNEAEYFKDFFDFGGSDVEIWNSTIGRRIDHNIWGYGTISAFAFANGINILLFVLMDTL